MTAMHVFSTIVPNIMFGFTVSLSLIWLFMLVYREMVNLASVSIIRPLPVVWRVS